MLEDGRLIEVVAAAEPLIEISGADPLHLVRIALASRQSPSADPDHAERPAHPPGSRHRGDGEGTGARIIEIEAPFDPEGGAYAQAPMIMPRTADGAIHESHHHHGDHDNHHHDEHATTITTTTIIPMLITASALRSTPSSGMNARGGAHVPA